jgi:PAS domain S-box-containing protein
MAKSTTKKEVSSFDLKDSDEKYRLLVENLNDAIVITQHNKYIYLNTQFADLLGYHPDELLMQDYRKVYSKEGLKKLEQRDQQRERG